jgi:hypothetical protein
MSSEGALAQRTRAEFERTQDAFDKVRAKLSDKLLSSAVGESLLREKLYFTVQALDAVRAHMVEAMATGDIEEHVENYLKSLQSDS